LKGCAVNGIPLLRSHRTQECRRAFSGYPANVRVQRQSGHEADVMRCPLLIQSRRCKIVSRWPELAPGGLM
jgi:hypothetical protein